MIGVGCKKCRTITAALFLVAGALYLLTDLKVVSFWSINWYTSLFLIIGVTGLAMGMCKDCQAMTKK